VKRIQRNGVDSISKQGDSESVVTRSSIIKKKVEAIVKGFL
jgi:hypothetical protein